MLMSNFRGPGGPHGPPVGQFGSRSESAGLGVVSGAKAFIKGMMFKAVSRIFESFFRGC